MNTHSEGMQTIGGTSEQSTKVFSVKSHFPPIYKHFLPLREKPVIYTEMSLEWKSGAALLFKVRFSLMWF